MRIDGDSNKFPKTGGVSDHSEYLRDFLCAFIFKHLNLSVLVFFSIKSEM